MTRTIPTSAVLMAAILFTAAAASAQSANKEPAQTPLYAQKILSIAPGHASTSFVKIEAAPGTRMVIETINMFCTSATTDQAVSLQVFKAGVSYTVASLLPPSVAWDSGMQSSGSAPVHLLVDDFVSVGIQRPTMLGHSDCSVTLSGYTTPLP